MLKEARNQERRIRVVLDLGCSRGLANFTPGQSLLLWDSGEVPKLECPVSHYQRGTAVAPLQNPHFGCPDALSSQTAFPPKGPLSGPPQALLWRLLAIRARRFVSSRDRSPAATATGNGMCKSG